MTWNRGNCEKPEISREKEKSLVLTLGLSWFLCLFPDSFKTAYEVLESSDVLGKDSDSITHCIV